MEEKNIDNTEQEHDKTKLTELDLVHHLLNGKELFYLSEDIDIQSFIANTEKRIKEELKFDTSYYNEKNVHIIAYKSKGGLSGSLGFKTVFKLFFIFDNNKLYFDIKNDKWFETGEDKFALSNLFSSSKYAEIKSYIVEYLLKNTVGDMYSLRFDDSNNYVNEISDKQKLWYYCNTEEEELMLAFLLLSAMQAGEGDINAEKDVQWYFLLTSHKIQLIAFNKREELIKTIDCAHDKIIVKKELGRNRFIFNELEFLIPRSNNDKFYEISLANLESNESRIRETSRLNWIYGKNINFSLELIRFLINEHHDLFDEMSLLFMEYSTGNSDEVFANYTDDNKLLNLLNKVLTLENSNELLMKWIDEWELSYIDSVAINDLLLASLGGAVQANNILPFHRYVRKKFHEKNADEINKVLFDIGFCRHLIKCGLLNEAKKILKKNLKHLPDESISDLLPSKDLDLTGTAAGQIIKVSILEMLIGIESEKDAIVHKCQMARLQPLVESRIEELIKVSSKELAEKGKELKELMQPGGLQTTYNENDEHPQFHYNSINAKILDKYVRHPFGSKGSKFTKFQKWVATVKTDDYTILKSYSEKLTATKYRDLNQIVEDITTALKIDSLEVYIARGDKSKEIICFEGEPNFMLVGSDYLDENSEYYLTPLELRFAVAGELAHLYFKHARITASDVWKGALDKGYFVLDTILTFVPAVSLFGKSIQGIGKLNAVSTFVQTTSKAGKISNTSKDILTASEQVVNIYKSKSQKEKKEEDKEKEFWATARVMQASSDRCALIFTKNIKSAVKTILLMSKSYRNAISTIEEIGLREFLLQKHENGNFSNQELAIRLSNLFSFYLSDEYNLIINKLEDENYMSDNEAIDN